MVRIKVVIDPMPVGADYLLEHWMIRYKAMTVADDGTLYFMDIVRNMIYALPLGGAMYWVAGSGSYGSADGLICYATFDGCYSMTVDKRGTLYILERAKSHIRRVRDGVVTTLSLSNPQGPFTFFNPLAICMDYDDESLLVVDPPILFKVDGKDQVSRVALPNDLAWVTSMYTCGRDVVIVDDSYGRIARVTDGGATGSDREVTYSDRIVSYYEMWEHIERTPSSALTWRDATYRTKPVHTPYVLSEFSKPISAERHGFAYFVTGSGRQIAQGGPSTPWTYSGHRDTPGVLRRAVKTVMLLRNKPCVWKGFPCDVAYDIFRSIHASYSE